MTRFQDNKGICMVLVKFYPMYGGAERQAYLLSRTLINSGEQVIVVTGRWNPEWPKNEKIGGISVRRTWCWGGKRKGLGRIGVWIYGLATIFEIWKLRRSIDILHVHQANEAAFFSVIARRLFGKRILIKVANSGVSSDYNQLINSRGEALGKRFWSVISDADCFVCINELIPDELISRNVLPEKLVRIPNGVEVEKPDAPPGQPPKINDFLESNPDSDRITIVFIGKLFHQKGVDILLDAWERIERKHPGRIQLLILGDGPLRTELVRKARTAGFLDSGSVIFSTRWIHSTDPFYEIADLLVLPSRSEGMPNVVLEAMSRGLPVVVTRIPGCMNLIVDGKTGVVVEPEHPDSLAEGLSKLISDENLRKTLGDNAQSTAREKYDIRKIASEYRKLYSALRNSDPGESF